jgi:hypothetical protein
MRPAQNIDESNWNNFVADKGDAGANLIAALRVLIVAKRDDKRLLSYENSEIRHKRVANYLLSQLQSVETVLLSMSPPLGEERWKEALLPILVQCQSSWKGHPKY